MFDLKQIIKKPTRITTEACPLLDHILCNNASSGKRQRTEAWMTCDIMNLIHERDKLLYSFKKSRCQEQYKQFCAVRNKVNREIKMPRLAISQIKLKNTKMIQKGCGNNLSR